MYCDLLEIDWRKNTAEFCITKDPDGDNSDDYAFVDCTFSPVLRYEEADYFCDGGLAWQVSEASWDLVELDNFRFVITDKGGQVEIDAEQLKQMIFDDFNDNYSRIIDDILE